MRGIDIGGAKFRENRSAEGKSGGALEGGAASDVHGGRVRIHSIHAWHEN
jgi:hypothetical protein